MDDLLDMCKLSRAISLVKIYFQYLFDLRLKNTTLLNGLANFCRTKS